MEEKITKAEPTTVTRNVFELEKNTGNIYESLVIMSKRSDQISTEIKEELDRKIIGFATPNDSLEEVFENREQIELAKHYERMSKPTLVAIHEFANDRVYFRKIEDSKED